MKNLMRWIVLGAVVVAAGFVDGPGAIKMTNTAFARPRQNFLNRSSTNSYPGQRWRNDPNFHSTGRGHYIQAPQYRSYRYNVPRQSPQSRVPSTNNWDDDEGEEGSWSPRSGYGGSPYIPDSRSHN